MTSANFATVLLDSIIIDRGNRQRRSLEKIEELADSITLAGLINPPVVTREHVLVAGERRVTALRLLGWTSCPVQYAEDLDQETLYLIELEENVKRVDLSWQDHVDAVEAYHQIRRKADPNWTQANTGDALGTTMSSVTQQLTVAKAIRESVTGVADAPKFSTALGIARRNTERKGASSSEGIEALVNESLGIVEPLEEAEATPTHVDRPVLLECKSALEFFETVQTRPYNFIHCDFPYGVNAGDKKGQSAAKAFGQYEDDPDVYMQLLSSFCKNVHNFTASSAHLMFWFAMDFYEVTCEALREAGWVVQPYPLVWHKSNNQGIIPDANRGPRRMYEVALLCSRGDRKIVRAVSNINAAPVTKVHHQAEKPKEMLAHFFRMLVDDSTRMLDPTAGSGNAVHASELAGAAFSHGLEIQQEYVDRAHINLELK